MALANGLKKALKTRLGERRLFYVCRDAERAEAGLALGLKNYRVIVSLRGVPTLWSGRRSNPPASATGSPRPSRLRPFGATDGRVGARDDILDTRELLQHPKTKKQIRRKDFVLVFKSTPQIEKVCLENGWRLLNPPAALAAMVEEKISQFKWLGKLKKFLPPGKITLLKNVRFIGERFILQFNRAHTGTGTFLIKNEKELDELKKKFPEREARISKFIRGPIFTNNNIVWGKKILTGNISYQITGLKPFTDNPFATIGNDWALPRKILSAKQIKDYEKIATAVGKKLSSNGWRGLFGIDVVLEEKTGRLYLLEINARQPASTSCESWLQRKQDNNGLTVFEAHLAALLGLKQDNRDLIKICDGGQVVKRINRQETIDNRQQEIKQNKKIRIIKYNNDKPGAELFRIQNEKGLVAGHNKFNKLGIEVCNLF